MAQEKYTLPVTGLDQKTVIDSNFTELYNLAGQSGITINPNWIFIGTDTADSESIRDAYFVTNSGELVDGIFVAVYTGYDSEYLIQSRVEGVWENVFNSVLIDDKFYPKASDNTTESHIPVKQDGNLENSNLTQDPDGKLRASTEIIAEGGVDTIPGTITMGDGLDVKASGGQQINESRVTGIKYQVPYQEVDKTGTRKTFELDAKPEIVQEVIQPVFDTALTSGVPFVITPANNQIINAVYFKTDNTVDNFRYQVTSVATGQPVDTYPNKFKFERGEGVTLTGAATHKIDLYYVDDSTPDRFIQGEDLSIVFEWEGAGSILGNSSGVPYYEYDYQKFEFVDVISEKDYATESISTSVKNFDGLSDNTATTIDIGAGSGRFVTDNGDGTVTVDNISWDARTNVTVTGIGTRATSLVVLNNNFDVLFLDGFTTSTIAREYLVLGTLTHATGTLTLVRSTPLKSITEYSQFIDTLLVMGTTRGSRLNIALNTNKTIIKEAGRLMLPGLGNNYPGSEGQNVVDVNGANPATFRYFLGATGSVIEVDPAATLLDNTRYDSGAGTPTTIGAPLNQATNIYIFQIPSANAGMNVMYGQVVYPTLQDAILNSNKEEIVIPAIIAATSNLLAVISIKAEAVDPLLDTDFYINRGPKFGVEFTGGAGAGGSLGGGNVVGPVSSLVNELPTYADLNGTSIKATSGISAASGKLEGLGLTELAVENSKFLPGDDLIYPVADGFKGDNVTTDGEGNLSFDAHNFDLITTSATIDKDNDRVYVDASAGAVDLTLADDPRNGERAQIWIGDNSNQIKLFTANPTYPLIPPVNVAEANLQGAWTLQSDFADRFTTARDLTQQGTGGVFEPVIVNGETVDAFNFAGTAYLEAVASAYPGITGISPRSFTCWYQANNGIPATNQNLAAWGEDVPPGGLLWEAEFRAGSGDYFWVNNRNAHRKWDLTTLDALGLFDGTMHHIAITQSNANMNSVLLYIDGVRITHDSQDTYPINTTTANTNFRIGAGWAGGDVLDAKLYDFRLFNKGLSLAEVESIRDQDLTGGLVISGLPNDTVIDVAYNGLQWVVADAVPLTLLDLDSRAEALESNSDQISRGDSVLSIDEFGDVSLEASPQGSAKLKLYSIAGRNSTVEYYEDGVRKVFAGYDALFNTYSINGSAMNLDLATGKWAINGLPNPLQDMALDFIGKSGVLGLPVFLTSEINALTGRSGAIGYDIQTDTVKFYSDTLDEFIDINTTESKSWRIGPVAGSESLTGPNQDIDLFGGQYVVNGIEDPTPPYSGGVFTIDEDGLYEINLYGYLSSPTATLGDRVIVFISIDGADFGSVTQAIESWGTDGLTFNSSRKVQLTAGQTLQLKSFVLDNDDGNWVLSRNGWEFNKIGD